MPTPKTPALIAKVEIVRARRAGWPVVKVREITEGGRVIRTWEHSRYDAALASARRLVREHRALGPVELITPTY